MIYGLGVKNLNVPDPRDPVHIKADVAWGCCSGEGWCGRKRRNARPRRILLSPVWPPLPHRALLFQPINPFYPSSQSWTWQGYLFVCLFIFYQISSKKKKNSVQGKNGIRPKSKQISALKSYLNRQYIKFLYLRSFKIFTHLALAWTIVTFVSKWTGKKVKKNKSINIVYH